MLGISNSYSAYNRAGLGGTYNLARMNNLRLYQAMTNTPVTAVRRVRPVKGQMSSPWAELKTDTADFLKQYQSKMAGMMEAAATLKRAGSSGASELSPSVSDAEVLDVEAKARLTQPTEIQVNVKQLATAQKNVMDPVNASDPSSLAGELFIQPDRGTGSVSVNMERYVNMTNREVLEAAAKDINAANTGVTARVKTDGGNSEKISLELVSDQTGEKNGFTVSGSFADTYGLSKVQQIAHDAVYTVQKPGDVAREQTSSGNKVQIGGYQLEAELKKTGSAAVSVAPDSEKTASAVQTLVDRYNDTMKFLKENADRGAGVLQQMRRMQSSPAAETSMQKVGLNFDKDGLFTFDKDTFMDFAAKNPSEAADIVSGLNGVAQGIFNDANAGLKVSSQSLVGTAIADSRNAFALNPLNAASTYNRNGLLNMMNYYSAGVLMNLNI